MREKSGSMKPYELSKAFEQLEVDWALLEKLHKQQQKEYLRRRLRAIRLLWEGKSRAEVEASLQVSPKTLINWMKVLVEQGVGAGLKELARAKTAQRRGKLSDEQQAEVIRIVEEEPPSQYGYTQNLFTAPMLVEIVADTWGISVSDQTIYRLFERQGFSHQRAHRDYGEPDGEAQRAFQDALEKNSPPRRRAKRSSSSMSSV